MVTAQLRIVLRPPDLERIDMPRVAKEIARFQPLGD
jgi:hypothetical protein